MSCPDYLGDTVFQLPHLPSRGGLQAHGFHHLQLVHNKQKYIGFPHIRIY